MDQKSLPAIARLQPRRTGKFCNPQSLAQTRLPDGGQAWLYRLNRLILAHSTLYDQEINSSPQRLPIPSRSRDGEGGPQSEIRNLPSTFLFVFFNCDLIMIYLSFSLISLKNCHIVLVSFLFPLHLLLTYTLHNKPILLKRISLWYESFPLYALLVFFLDWTFNRYKSIHYLGLLINIRNA